MGEDLPEGRRRNLKAAVPEVGHVCPVSRAVRPALCPRLPRARRAHLGLASYRRLPWFPLSCVKRRRRERSDRNKCGQTPPQLSASRRTPMLVILHVSHSGGIPESWSAFPRQSQDRQFELDTSLGVLCADQIDIPGAVACASHAVPTGYRIVSAWDSEGRKVSCSSW